MFELCSTDIPSDLQWHAQGVQTLLEQAAKLEEKDDIDGRDKKEMLSKVQTQMQIN